MILDCTAAESTLLTVFRENVQRMFGDHALGLALASLQGMLFFCLKIVFEYNIGDTEIGQIFFVGIGEYLSISPNSFEES